jgi:hypothetical protein
MQPVNILINDDPASHTVSLIHTPAMEVSHPQLSHNVQTTRQYKTTLLNFTDFYRRQSWKDWNCVNVGHMTQPCWKETCCVHTAQSAQSLGVEFFAEPSRAECWRKKWNDCSDCHTTLCSPTSLIFMSMAPPQPTWRQITTHHSMARHCGQKGLYNDIIKNNYDIIKNNYDIIKNNCDIIK